MVKFKGVFSTILIATCQNWTTKQFYNIGLTLIGWLFGQSPHMEPPPSTIISSQDLQNEISLDKGIYFEFRMCILYIYNFREMKTNSDSP